ncbi:MAG: nucleoside triphosphate pyrophosphohydrolase [Xenococcus sp. MO_188.B8]|nr:nucleoside triphosphate pyrophosphohydrolase [Xenococcus sp. MO_188.B8]
MKTEHNKLVRDKIPDIIRASNNQYEILTLSDAEYIDALKQKLLEEANEAAIASPDELAQELADIYEVIDALLAAAGIEKETVKNIQKQKRSIRGGFDNKIKLLWTELNN